MKPIQCHRPAKSHRCSNLCYACCWYLEAVIEVLIESISIAAKLGSSAVRRSDQNQMHLAGRPGTDAPKIRHPRLPGIKFRSSHWFVVEQQCTARTTTTGVIWQKAMCVKHQLNPSRKPYTCHVVPQQLRHKEERSIRACKENCIMGDEYVRCTARRSSVALPG